MAQLLQNAKFITTNNPRDTVAPVFRRSFAPTADIQKAELTVTATYNGDGTWTLGEAVACAEEKATSTGAAVRKVGYATLQEAIDAVANGKTVTTTVKATGAALHRLTRIRSISGTGSG